MAILTCPYNNFSRATSDVKNTFWRIYVVFMLFRRQTGLFLHPSRVFLNTEKANVDRKIYIWYKFRLVYCTQVFIIWKILRQLRYSTFIGTLPVSLIFIMLLYNVQHSPLWHECNTIYENSNNSNADNSLTSHLFSFWLNWLDHHHAKPTASPWLLILY